MKAIRCDNCGEFEEKNCYNFYSDDEVFIKKIGYSLFVRNVTIEFAKPLYTNFKYKDVDLCFSCKLEILKKVIFDYEKQVKEVRKIMEYNE